MFTTQKIDEVKMKVIDGVKSTDDLNVLLRIGWGAETTNRMAFKPADDLKVGDELSVTVEKLIEVVEQPKPEATAKAAEVVESAGNTQPVPTDSGEAAPAAGGETACACAENTVAEAAVAMEKKEEEPELAKEPAPVAVNETAPVSETESTCSCAAGQATESIIEEPKAEEPPVDKIGETIGTLATNVSQENNPRLLLRVIYKKKTDEVPITLAEPLKPRDQIKVTVIRTQKAPEPVPAEGAAAPAQG